MRNERTKVISWRGNLWHLALWGRQRLHLSSSNQSSSVSLCFTSSPLSFSHSTPLSRNTNASSDPLLSIPSRPYSSLPFLIWRAQVRNPNSSFHLLFPCLFHRYLPFYFFFHIYVHEFLLSMIVILVLGKWVMVSVFRLLDSVEGDPRFVQEFFVGFTGFEVYAGEG